MKYIRPVDEAVKATIALGWTVEQDGSRSAQKSNVKRRSSKIAVVSLTHICTYSKTQQMLPPLELIIDERLNSK